MIIIENVDETSWPARRLSFVCKKYWPEILVSRVTEQTAGNISDRRSVNTERYSQLTVTKLRQSETPFICRYWVSVNVQQMADVMLYLEPR
jgi:hypothetical protein